MPSPLATAALVLGLLAAGVRPAPAQAPGATPVETHLARLDAYFESYHDALGQLVADERLVQSMGGADSGSVTGRSQPLKVTREIRSEVAFIDLPGNAGWLGLRDVITVSGRRVRSAGPSLAEILSSGAGAHDQARALLAESARHNLGEPRTTNLPNVPLELLHQRNRWRYESRVDGHERIEGHQTALVVLDEKASPTIIQRPEGGDIVARVAAWIELETGRLWRVQLRLTDGRLSFARRHPPVEMMVEFVEHEKLGLLVPDRMTETFYAATRGAGRGEARYSNFRRFGTAARVVPR